jgi:hypothetical protein
MRKFSLASLVVAVAFGSSMAWAQTDPKAQDAPPSVDAKKMPVKDPEEVICIRQQQIGSRVPGPSECHSRRVWDEMSDQAHRNAQDLQRRSMVQVQKGG